MLPWHYSHPNTPITQFLDRLGLLPAYYLQSTRYLVLADKLIRQEVGGWNECSKKQWEDRQSLAYFINLHILSKGEYGYPNACEEIASMIKDAWYPGATVPRLASGQPHTPSVGAKPYNAYQNFQVLTVDGSLQRTLLQEDTELPDCDNFWEIYPHTLRAANFHNGRKQWIEAVDKHWKTWWKALTASIQKDCHLTQKELWLMLHPSPEKVS